MQYFAYSQKAFVYKYIVMLSDVDQFKHMSFANYLKLMFLSTDALFLSCFDQDFLGKCRVKLLNSKMQFKRQTVAGDSVLVKVNSGKLEENGFTLLYTFVIEGTGELVGLGKQSYRLMRPDGTDEAVPLTDAVRNVLQPIFVDEEHLIYQY